MQWRNGPKNSLFARTIHKTEWPQLIAAMMEHGTIAVIEERGVVWYYGPYEISARVVAKVWGLSTAQQHRFKTHILECDPFGGDSYEGNRYLDE